MATNKTTSASEWGKNLNLDRISDLHELPSGNVARLRKTFPVRMLLNTGVLTQDLYDAFLGDNQDFDAVKKLNALVVSVMFVEPKVSIADKAPAGAVHVSQLDEVDIEYVQGIVSGEDVSDTFPGDTDSEGHSGDGPDLPDPA